MGVTGGILVDAPPGVGADRLHGDGSPETWISDRNHL